jgi:hypothetical protein
MNSPLIILVCAVLGFGIVWTLLGARETDKKINESHSDPDSDSGQ